MSGGGKGNAERRAMPRFSPDAFPSLNGAYLRGGASVDLIDISTGGALVESVERLTPNTKICLKVVTSDGTFMVQGRILRSIISQLTGGPRYRSGISFDNKFPLQAADSNPEAVPDIEAAAEQCTPPSIQSVPPEAQQPGNNREDHGMEETLTLTATMPQIALNLQQYFECIKVNNW